MKNNWKPVIEDIINCLLENNLTLVSVDNGDGEVEVDNFKDAVNEIDATDVSDLYVRNPDGKVRWIQIVLGNEPFETVSDYTCDPLIDKACEEFSAMWEGRSVPKIEH